MFKKLRSFLHFLITGSVTFLIAACYGVPYNVGMNDLDVKAQDNTGQPIPGLDVEISTHGSVITNLTTDQNGTASFTASTNIDLHQVVVSDVDGSQNGGPYTPHTNFAYPWVNLNVTMD